MILALSKPISERSAVPSILEAHRLYAGYGEVRVLKDVSLHVAQGSITAVIGSNGAGKTTLMRTLTGLISPEQGSTAQGSAYRICRLQNPGRRGFACATESSS